MQVHLLVGNRDINKLRMFFELQNHVYADRNHPPVVYWLQARPHLYQDCGYTLEDRCAWMLSKTMGSPNAFEHRKRELESFYPYHDSISNKLVAQSFVDLVDPMFNGTVRQIFHFSPIILLEILHKAKLSN